MLDLTGRSINVISLAGLAFATGMVLEEGNRNYGENLMLFDQLFGTYINPDRRPPRTIGIHDPMPNRLFDQIAHPFRTVRSVVPAAE